MSKKVMLFIFLALLFLISLYVIKTQTSNTFSGINSGEGEYTEFVSCSKESQLVIKRKRLPKNQIHSCMETYYNLDGEKYYVVEVYYGPAQDCPSGCFYDYFIGAVSENGKVIDLPRKNGTDSLSLAQGNLPNSDTYKLDSECNYSLGEVVSSTLSEVNGRLGWKYTFSIPLECRWKEIKSTVVTMEYRFINTGDEVIRIWNGDFFIYLQNGSLKGDFTNITSAETLRIEIVFESE